MKRLLCICGAALMLFLAASGVSVAGDCGTVAVSSSPPAAGTWSSPCQPEGTFTISVRGTFSATVTLQRSTDFASLGDNANWYDVDTYSSPIEGDAGYDPERTAYYRIGVKNGEYTSGTATCRLGK